MCPPASGTREHGSRYHRLTGLVCKKVLTISDQKPLHILHILRLFADAAGYKKMLNYRLLIFFQAFLCLLFFSAFNMQDFLTGRLFFLQKKMPAEILPAVLRGFLFALSFSIWYTIYQEAGITAGGLSPPKQQHR